MKNSMIEVPRKDERVTVPFDSETLRRVEELAKVQERPVSRQVLLLVKAALALMDEQGYKLVDGKLVNLKQSDQE